MTRNSYYLYFDNQIEWLRKKKLFLVYLVILNTTFVVLASPLAMGRCDGTCPSIIESRVSSEGHLNLSTANLDNVSKQDLPNASFIVQRTCGNSGESRSITLRSIPYAENRYSAFHEPCRQVIKKGREYPFQLSIIIHSNDTITKSLKPWGENNTILFNLSWSKRPILTPLDGNISDVYFEGIEYHDRDKLYRYLDVIHYIVYKGYRATIEIPWGCKIIIEFWKSTHYYYQSCYWWESKAQGDSCFF